MIKSKCHTHSMPVPLCCCCLFSFKNYRIHEVTKLKENLINVHDKIRYDVDLHFQEIIENEIKAKKMKLKIK